jgi:hypothetical protein
MRGCTTVIEGIRISAISPIIKETTADYQCTGVQRHKGKWIRFASG